MASKGDTGKREALQGVRIVDVTQVWSGPYCTELLGGLGAEVIKVESIQRPDLLHSASPAAKGPKAWEANPLFHTFNLNKLDITLDLTRPQGRGPFLQLVALSDVVIENFTSGVMDRWGLGYQALKERRPDIIMLSMPGFGNSGPYAGYRALGATMEAMAGLSWMTGYTDGPPMRCGINYGDPIAGLYAAFALLAALQHRLDTGHGQYMELSQLEALATLIPEAFIDYVMNGRTAERLGNRNPAMAPHGCYPCRGDDQWVTIAVTTQEEWQALCRALGRPTLVQDSRFATTLSRLQHQEEMDACIREWTVQRTAQEAMRLLQQAGVAAGAVNTARELLDDPHLQARGAFQVVSHPVTGEKAFRDIPWKLSATPGGIRKPPPLLGEHNRYVLEGLMGISSQEFAKLAEEKVIGDQPLASQQ